MNSRNDRCEKYSGLIEDLLAGELDAPTGGQLNAHIFACPHCLKEYETLRREKEIYARYLFDVEPPQDLWTNFQARLVSEKENAATCTVVPAASSRSALNIFGFLRLSPVAATAAVLLFGLGIVFIWSKLAPVGQNTDETLAENIFKDSPAPPEFNEIERQSATADLTTKTIDGSGDAPKVDKSAVKNQPLQANDKLPVKGKLPTFETAKIKQKTASASEKSNPRNVPAANEEGRLAARRLKNLEIEIAGQIEKTELLLRSFRNARQSGNVGAFDVEYERVLARKLLAENRRLRRDAENYGIVYAEELFSRTEPYLLDIANLEANPPAGKVLEIKERVSSQNIIARLQVYSSAATAATATAPAMQ